MAKKYYHICSHQSLEQRVGTYDTPYKYTGKEWDELRGLYYYGARYYNPMISNFMSVDRFAGKFPHQSPYSYASNNPINFIDINGDSTDVYSANGGYIETIADGNDYYSGQYHKSTSDYCNEGKGISFEYNDSNDRKDLKSGASKIVVANDTYINSFVDQGVEGLTGGLWNTITEGKDSGTLDYNWGKHDHKVPENTFTITNSAEGGTVGYNMADFGNYLTGQSLNRLGFASGWTSLFGHGNNLIYGPSDHGSRKASGWFDSAEDQRALSNGFGHYKAIKKFSPKFISGYKF